jgi:hypothetical protein
LTAGFEGFHVAGKCEVFDGAAIDSGARGFGAKGVWFSANKPG